MLAELRRIGQAGRKAVVDEWSSYLPSYVEPSLSLMSETLSEEHENEGGDQILEGKIPRDMCFGSFFKCLHGLKRLLSDGNGSKEFIFFIHVFTMTGIRLQATICAQEIILQDYILLEYHV